MRCFVLLVLPAIFGVQCYAGRNDDNGGAVQGNAAQAGRNDDFGGAVQGNAAQNAGQDSQGQDYGAGAARIQPRIIPYGADDSGEQGNQANMNGYIPPQTGGGAQTGQGGYIPPQAAGPRNGDSSNSVDPVAGINGNPLAGASSGGAARNGASVSGGDAGLIMQHQGLKESPGMSGAAVAGVVAGVVAVGAVGTAVAVVALKSR